jgi:hypothetical protein
MDHILSLRETTDTMSSSSQINQSIKPAVQAVSTDLSADPYIDAESPFEAATFAAASWRLKLDQLKCLFVCLL